MPLQVPDLPPVSSIEVAREAVSPWEGRDLVREAVEGAVPWLGGRAFLVGDLATGQVLASHRGDQMLPIASLTKIMTVTVALERFGPDAMVTVTPEAYYTEGSKVPLLLGDRVSVHDLVVACIVRSGNDAAVALATHAPGGTQEFVGWMNEKAATLHLEGTHFANPMGFDAPDHYATAQALFDLSRYALRAHPELRQIAGMREAEVHGAAKVYRVASTNELLGDAVLQVLGFKTGTTDGAGQSLITLIKAPDGRELMSVVLGSQSRFGETKTLLWWLQDKITGV